MVRVIFDRFYLYLIFWIGYYVLGTPSGIAVERSGPLGSYIGGVCERALGNLSPSIIIW
jgi:hypothetical protein